MIGRVACESPAADIPSLAFAIAGGGPKNERLIFAPKKTKLGPPRETGGEVGGNFIFGIAGRGCQAMLLFFVGGFSGREETKASPGPKPRGKMVWGWNKGGLCYLGPSPGIRNVYFLFCFSAPRLAKQIREPV